MVLVHMEHFNNVRCEGNQNCAHSYTNVYIEYWIKLDQIQYKIYYIIYQYNQTKLNRTEQNIYIDKWPQVNYRHSIDKWWELESGVYTIIIYNIRKKHFSLKHDVILKLFISYCYLWLLFLFLYLTKKNQIIRN